MNLRSYQQNARDATLRAWLENTSTLVVMPTGTGKTVLFASVIKLMQPARAMVIAHREELIWQARDKIKTFTGLECSLEMGELWSNTGSLLGTTPVVVSTIQTQNSRHGDRKRMSRFKPSDFGVLIIDEAHHATADSYRNLINYYRQNNPQIKILGVTATPDRADEEALGQVFESVAYDYEILDAIHDGWLVPIEQQFVNVAGLDFSQMRTTAGDLNGADLAMVMEAERNVQGVAGSSIEIIKDRRTIVFTASVKQAETLCNIFNRHRPGMADWVCGTTNKDDRREMLQRFQDGNVQVICNCGVLTEGFDNPGVEIIVMARPTKSRSLYAQMAGRSTRPLAGVVDGIITPDARKEAIRASAKPSCLIVDFVGNSGRHKLMSSADILGGKVSDDILERAVAKAKVIGKRVSISQLIDEEQEIDRERLIRQRQQEEARKAKLVAKVKFTTKKVDPFNAFDIEPVKTRGWDQGKVLSEKQKALLLRQGINPDNIPYAHARQLINEMFRRWSRRLCTLKQASLLKKHGYETKNLTMADATKLIDAIARNGWRRPIDPPQPQAAPIHHEPPQPLEDPKLPF